MTELPPPILEIAAEVSRSPEEIMSGVAAGKIVILNNPRHAKINPAFQPAGVGEGLRTKVNANLGTSPEFTDLENELRKLEICIQNKADAVMDLSTAGDLDAIRRKIIENSPLPVGTVPVYQAMVEAKQKYPSLFEMTADDLFRVIEKHAADGVDFITVHCGVTRKIIKVLEDNPRLMDIVSRGGSFLYCWMLYNKEENPLYAQFDRLLEIAKKFNLVLSLGDGLRPGCLADATDAAQIQELMTLGELTQRAWKAGVQIIIEGPGHVPFDQIAANVKLQKQLCHGAPFYVLGPLVTDVAPGYDHITSAIGGTAAASAGADFLCYVTPSEHLGLPTLEEVKEGLIAARIAAHAADLVKGIPGAASWDKAMSEARRRLDWGKQIELAIDPETARRLRTAKNTEELDVCSMCGDYCSLKMINGSRPRP